MTSAYFLEGLTYASNIGFTNRVYCSITPCTSRPRSHVSRLMRLARRTSSSVSTKIFMLSSARTSSMASVRMPSKMMTSAGYTFCVFANRLWKGQSHRRQASQHKSKAPLGELSQPVHSLLRTRLCVLKS